MERIDYFKAKLDATISPMGYQSLVNETPESVILVDVRIGAKAQEERIPGSWEIPLNQLEERINEFPKDKTIILYCWDTWCTLAAKAAIPLLHKGYDAKELYGGIAAWKKIGFSVQKEEGDGGMNCYC